MPKGKAASDFYKSECGQYICRMVGHWGHFEAWNLNGSTHWRHDNRIRTWADQDKFKHPMVYCVGGYHCETMDQKKGSFTIDLMHCDPTKSVEPFTGNTVIESLPIVFRRKIPLQNVPRWAKTND